MERRALVNTSASSLEIHGIGLDLQFAIGPLAIIMKVLFYLYVILGF
jgi:hypothetical protein